MGVGMNDSIAIPHDRHVAGPEHQIATLQSFGLWRIQCSAENILLHVAVARAAGASGVQRYLYEPGTIDPKTALAAPQVRRADEAFGHRDEICFMAVDAADMQPRQIPALARHGKSTVIAHHRDL